MNQKLHTDPATSTGPVSFVVSPVKEISVVTKIKRNPEKFDSFELYTKLCAKQSLDISEPSSVEEIIKTLKIALKENHKNLNLVFGKRVESMFSTVAASLGKCALNKARRWRRNIL